MTIFRSVGLCLLLLLMTACSSDEHGPIRPEDCLKNRPDSIPGLQIKGTRSERNVIDNMWPLVCRVRQRYQERLKENPRLKGTLEVTLTVEFNGEIGPFDITRNTLNDPLIEKELRTLIEFKDFDPYGPNNSESEIRLPIDLRP